MADDFDELDPSALPVSNADSQGTPGGTATGVPVASVTGDADKGIQIKDEADLAALAQLADLGINPSNAADFVRAKNALDTLNRTLVTDPDTMLAQLETANPDAYYGLLDKAASRFLKHFPPPEDGKPADGGKGSAPKSDPRVDALESEVRVLRTSREAEERQTKAKAVEAEYNKRLDGLIAQADDKAHLSAKDKRFLRLETGSLVASDETARRRIAQGVFVDLPKHFASALSTVAAETKTATKTEQDKRAGVVANGVHEPAAGPENKGGSPTAADDWDDVASAFAADLARTK